MSEKKDNFDLINLNGPLTVEAILKTIQRRFNEGYCYVSHLKWILYRFMCSCVSVCVQGYGLPTSIAVITTTFPNTTAAIECVWSESLVALLLKCFTHNKYVWEQDLVYNVHMVFLEYLTRFIVWIIEFSNSHSKIRCLYVLQSSYGIIRGLQKL